MTFTRVAMLTTFAVLPARLVGCGGQVEGGAASSAGSLGPVATTLGNDIDSAELGEDDAANVIAVYNPAGALPLTLAPPFARVWRRGNADWDAAPKPLRRARVDGDLLEVAGRAKLTLSKDGLGYVTWLEAQTVGKERSSSFLCSIRTVAVTNGTFGQDRELLHFTSLADPFTTKPSCTLTSARVSDDDGALTLAVDNGKHAFVVNAGNRVDIPHGKSNVQLSTFHTGDPLACWETDAASLACGVLDASGGWLIPPFELRTGIPEGQVVRAFTLTVNTLNRNVYATWAETDEKLHPTAIWAARLLPGSIEWESQIVYDASAYKTVTLGDIDFRIDPYRMMLRWEWRGLENAGPTSNYDRWTAFALQTDTYWAHKWTVPYFGGKHSDIYSTDWFSDTRGLGQTYRIENIDLAHSTEGHARVLMEAGTKILPADTIPELFPETRYTDPKFNVLTSDVHVFWTRSHGTFLTWTESKRSSTTSPADVRSLRVGRLP